jgi:uncharacterized phiE125 gp8 family phage protein
MNYNAILDVMQTDTGAEPCTLAEAKEWCKVELNITEENTLITELIKTARLQCEGFTNISFVEKNIETILNNSLGGIEFPYGPVKTFTSLINEDGETLVINEDYKIQGVLFKTLKEPLDCYLKATYVAGYTTLPTNFKTAVLQQVAYLYENRGDTPADATRQNNTSVPTELSPMVKLTLNPYRRIW